MICNRTPNLGVIFIRNLVTTGSSEGLKSKLLSCDHHCNHPIGHHAWATQGVAHAWLAARMLVSIAQHLLKAVLEPLLHLDHFSGSNGAMPVPFATPCYCVVHYICPLNNASKMITIISRHVHKFCDVHNIKQQGTRPLNTLCLNAYNCNMYGAQLFISRLPQSSA